MDTSTLPCQGLGPKASLAYSCCSTGSPGDGGQSGGPSSLPPLRDEKQVQKEMVSRLWLWVQMAWDGRAGTACPAWQSQAFREGPHGEGSSVGRGGPRRGWPGLPACRAPSVVGSPAGTGAMGTGQPCPSPLPGGAPTLGVYIMFISVHRSTALPATGRAVFMAEEAGGQICCSLRLPGTRLSPCSLAS